ncbi:MAG: hemolysin family protein [Candidatus Delongbacteria bacterium]|jgi:putative hemolysin|nr:hemolysin family protein [Candidatus Delongbacteria bacterium]
MTFIATSIFSFILIIFFSATETAFTAAHIAKIKLSKKSGKSFADKVEKFVIDPDRFLVPTLVGTNFSYVAFASSLTYLLLEFNIRSLSHFEVVLYESIVIAIFAEVIPKIIAKNSADKAVFVLIVPLIFFKYILAPINILVGKLGRIILHIMKVEINEDETLLVTKLEINNIMGHAVRHESMDIKEALIIKKIMELNENKIKEIMTHRKSIIGVDISSPVYKLNKLIKVTSLSKIIIYEKDLDNIKGVIFVNDTLNNMTSIEEKLKPIRFVPDTISVLSLFKTFKKDKTSIVVAIDEFGGCTGVVTMHDILESIVGKVDDIHDNEITDRGIIYREEQKILIVNGEAGTDDLNNMFKNLTGSDENLVEEDYETINGFLINHLQIIPQEGEEFIINKLKFKIARSKKNMIQSVIVKLPELK